MDKATLETPQRVALPRFAAAVAAYVAASGVAGTDYAVGQVRRHLRQVVLAELLPRIDAALAALLPAVPA